MSVYVSTSCLKNGKKLLDVLERYKKIGLKDIELGSSHEYVDGLIDYLRSYEANFIVHHYFPPLKESFILNLASQNPSILTRSREQIKKGIDLCYRLGSELFTFHAGFRADPDNDLTFGRNLLVTPYAKALNTFVESVKEINKYAEDLGIRIAIENNVLPKYGTDRLNKVLMCKYEEFENLFQKIFSDNVGVLLDLGHLKVTSHWLCFDKCEFVEKLGDKTFLIHVHENNGRVDEHRGLDKKSWCLEIVGRKHFEGVPIVLESWHLDLKEIVRNKKLIEKHVTRYV